MICLGHVVPTKGTRASLKIYITNILFHVIGSPKLRSVSARVTLDLHIYVFRIEPIINFMRKLLWKPQPPDTWYGIDEPVCELVLIPGPSRGKFELFVDLVFHPLLVLGLLRLARDAVSFRHFDTCHLQNCGRWPRLSVLKNLELRRDVRRELIFVRCGLGDASLGFSGNRWFLFFGVSNTLADWITAADASNSCEISSPSDQLILPSTMTNKNGRSAWVS